MIEGYNIKKDLSKNLLELIDNVIVKLNTSNKVRYLEKDDVIQEVLLLIFKKYGNIDYSTFIPTDADYEYVFKQIYCRYRDYSISSEDITSNNSNTYEYYDNPNNTYYTDDAFIEFFLNHYTEFLTNKQIEYMDNRYIISPNNRYSINRRIEKRAIEAAYAYIDRIFTTYIYMCIYYHTYPAGPR